MNMLRRIPLLLCIALTLLSGCAGIVNKASGDPGSFLPERHDASDFDGLNV